MEESVTSFPASGPAAVLSHQALPYFCDITIISVIVEFSTGIF